MNNEEKNLQNTPVSEENVEILCNREVGGDWATIYFSDGSGWIISNGESKIQIKSDGTLLLTNNMPHRDIEISNDAIRLGTAKKSDFDKRKRKFQKERRKLHLQKQLKLLSTQILLHPNLKQLNKKLIFSETRRSC